MKYIMLVLVLEVYTLTVELALVDLPPIAYALPFAFVILVAFLLWLSLFAFIAISPQTAPPIDD